MRVLRDIKPTAEQLVILRDAGTPVTVRHDRTGKPADWPTNRQAEVLYPGGVPCEYLRRIDVQREDTIDTMHGILGGLGLSVPVRHAPEVFE